MVSSQARKRLEEILAQQGLSMGFVYGAPEQET